MVELDLMYWNYEHGGLGRSSPGYDFGPLVRVVGKDDRWPDVLIVGESDRYDWDGGAGMWGAVAAMRKAGGPAYTPLQCSLPRDWGPYAPCMFVNQQKVQIERWYDPYRPGFGARHRNVLEATVPGRSERWRIATGHGALSGGLQRLLDAQELRPLADETVPIAIGMDWNGTLSGPWEHRDLNDRTKYGVPWRLANRILWQHGRAQQGPFQPDTRALDYLCGYWHPPRGWRRLWRNSRGYRAGGIGFHWVGELVGDYTPTNLPTATGRQQTAIDGWIVNDPWREAIVPGSYCVQELDPNHPESDHRPVRVALNI